MGTQDFRAGEELYQGGTDFMRVERTQTYTRNRSPFLQGFEQAG